MCPGFGSFAIPPPCTFRPRNSNQRHPQYMDRSEQTDFLHRKYRPDAHFQDSHERSTARSASTCLCRHPQSLTARPTLRPPTAPNNPEPTDMTASHHLPRVAFSSNTSDSWQVGPAGGDRYRAEEIMRRIPRLKRPFGRPSSIVMPWRLLNNSPRRRIARFSPHFFPALALVQRNVGSNDSLSNDSLDWAVG
jgi:hypothetical protein